MTLISLLLLFVLALQAVERPHFMLPPAIRRSTEEVRLTVWSERNPKRRWIVVEAWEVDDTGGETLYRSSREPATGGQRAFYFKWLPMPRGKYHLYARVVVDLGLSYRSIRHILLVL